MNIDIDRITLQDLRSVGELQPEGWSVITDNFIQYINYDFCYPIKVTEAGQIVGLGNILMFPTSAWLTHIIVDPNYQGEGIGSAIVDYLLHLARQASIPSVALMASEMGEPIYKKAGFNAVCDYIEFRKTTEAITEHVDQAIVPYAPSYRRQILDLDKRITGENREALLDSFMENSMVYLEDNQVMAYHLPFLGEGPIYALHRKAGTAMMRLHYALNDKAVVPADNLEAISFLEEQGFERVGLNGKRMVWGEPIHWNGTQVYSRINGAYG